MHTFIVRLRTWMDGQYPWGGWVVHSLLAALWMTLAKGLALVVPAVLWPAAYMVIGAYLWRELGQIIAAERPRWLSHVGDFLGPAMIAVAFAAR